MFVVLLCLKFLYINTEHKNRGGIGTNAEAGARVFRADKSGTMEQL